MVRKVAAAEIRAAGGLQKWATKAAHASPMPEVPIPQKEKAHASPAAEQKTECMAAKGRKPSDLILGYSTERMNGLETRYAGRLEEMKRAGRLITWKFEEIKLRMADSTFYTPDFFIMLPDGTVGFHETKGFWRDDARAKIKIAAELYPMFFFMGVQWDTKAKEWIFERFRNVDTI